MNIIIRDDQGPDTAPYDGRLLITALLDQMISYCHTQLYIY